jgi:hypothetical protein
MLGTAVDSAARLTNYGTTAKAATLNQAQLPLPMEARFWNPRTPFFISTVGLRYLGQAFLPQRRSSSQQAPLGAFSLIAPHGKHATSFFSFLFKKKHRDKVRTGAGRPSSLLARSGVYLLCHVCNCTVAKTIVLSTKNVSKIPCGKVLTIYSH